MEASNGVSPCGTWQLWHCASSAWNPPGWLAPVAKFTSSWQAPQAARDGSVMYALAWAALVVWSWHTSQRCTMAGSTTVEKSETEFRNPTIWYGTPGVVLVPTTLGSDEPMWILCANTLRSSELPVAGSAF